MIFSRNLSKADVFGACASALCLAHCAATPFLFIAKACSATCCSSTPTWWRSIDYIFLAVSFIAIFYAAKKASHKWVVTALWASWTLLAAVLLNEIFTFVSLPPWAIYIPALAIVGFHIYNLRTHKCADENCVVSPAKFG